MSLLPVGPASQSVFEVDKVQRIVQAGTTAMDERLASGRARAYF